MQPPSFGEPSPATDPYANGGQNYYAAGWQPAQPARPKTAELSAGPLVPKLWGAREDSPSSAAQTQPSFANSQVGMHFHAQSTCLDTRLSVKGIRCLQRRSSLCRCHAA
jgi:hypothetical protein